MIDHIGFAVSDLSAARGFYERALAPLGILVLMDVTEQMTGGHGAHMGFDGLMMREDISPEDVDNLIRKLADPTKCYQERRKPHQPPEPYDELYKIRALSEEQQVEVLKMVKERWVANNKHSLSIEL